MYSCWFYAGVTVVLTTRYIIAYGPLALRTSKTTGSINLVQSLPRRLRLIKYMAKQNGRGKTDVDAADKMACCRK